MTTIFVSFAKEDTACAEHILHDLEAQGYTTWREPTTLTMESILYPRTIENVILGSAAVVLVWSSHAVQSEWVERHRLFVQSLKKLIFPVELDGTGLPNTLVGVTPVKSQAPCTDAVASLLAQPNFPPSQSTDPLIALSEKAAHEFIRVRKEAIDQAAEMLQRGEHREAVLAILEYLASKDLMMGVRDKAQEVIDADANKAAPPPLRPGESRHIFGVRCKNGHITYFDKRRVCVNEKLVRGSTQRAGAALTELDLPCGECGVEVPVRVDCGGY
jgi:hypothetical protein